MKSRKSEKESEKREEKIWWNGWNAYLCTPIENEAAEREEEAKRTKWLTENQLLEKEKKKEKEKKRFGETVETLTFATRTKNGVEKRKKRRRAE